MFYKFELATLKICFKFCKNNGFIPGYKRFNLQSRDYEWM